MDSSEYTCQDPGLSFDKETEKKIKEFQDELIENPVTPKDIKFNQKIDKKIRYEKAVVAVTSGQIKNCRVASNLYGVKYRINQTAKIKSSSSSSPFIIPFRYQCIMNKSIKCLVGNNL